MPFGDTAKKIQKVTTLAEKLYERMNHVVEQVQDLRERAESTGERIEAIERELAEQRAIVEAVAESEGIDVERAVAERVESPADETGEEASEADGEAAADRAEDAGDDASDGATGSDVDDVSAE